jgi:hypothetical protein
MECAWSTGCACAPPSEQAGLTADKPAAEPGSQMVGPPSRADGGRGAPLNASERGACETARSIGAIPRSHDAPGKGMAESLRAEGRMPLPGHNGGGGGARLARVSAARDERSEAQALVSPKMNRLLCAWRRRSFERLVWNFNSSSGSPVNALVRRLCNSPRRINLLRTSLCRLGWETARRSNEKNPVGVLGAVCVCVSNDSAGIGDWGGLTERTPLACAGRRTRGC